MKRGGYDFGSISFDDPIYNVRPDLIEGLDKLRDELVERLCN
jgi:hypothetical protein